MSNKNFNTTAEFWFPTRIYYKDVENSEELNKELLKNILKWKKEDEKGIFRSNTTGWHSAVTMHQRKEFKDLVTELFKMQNDIFKHEEYNTDTMPIIDNMWANVNYKGSHNKNHVHPGALWSGVYYIQVPENSGNIWFSDPAPQKIMDQPIIKEKPEQWQKHLTQVHYKSMPGRLIMFPGWLTHEVDVNASKEKGQKSWRISVSFNFKQVWKPTAVKKTTIHDAKPLTFEEMK